MPFFFEQVDYALQFLANPVLALEIEFPQYGCGELIFLNLGFQVSYVFSTPNLSYDQAYLFGQIVEEVVPPLIYVVVMQGYDTK